MDRYRIYDWSAHLFEPSFSPTFAYKTSTTAGSSFIYSIAFTSSCRGFPSVMSLREENTEKYKGSFYHRDILICSHPTLCVLVVIFFMCCVYVKNALSCHVLLQKHTAEAGAHGSRKSEECLGALNECLANFCKQKFARGIIHLTIATLLLQQSLVLQHTWSCFHILEGIHALFSLPCHSTEPGCQRSSEALQGFEKCFLPLPDPTYWITPTN